MKIRTINEAYKELKNTDPKTAMTLSGLRRLVNEGTMPSLRIGRRILINYDGLVELLRKPNDKPQADSEHGTIRKIND